MRHSTDHTPQACPDCGKPLLPAQDRYGALLQCSGCRRNFYWQQGR